MDRGCVAAGRTPERPFSIAPLMLVNENTPDTVRGRFSSTFPLWLENSMMAPFAGDPT